MQKKMFGKHIASSKKRNWWLPVCILILIILGVLLTLTYFRQDTVPHEDSSEASRNVMAYEEKIALLKNSAMTEETQEKIGKSPAGGQAGNAVFLSICDTSERASVFCGKGVDLASAWDAANEQVITFLENSNYDPVWVKVDIVSASEKILEQDLEKAIRASRHEFYRYGLAFDSLFETALLEAELNGAKIYDYDDGGIDAEYLNNYLKKAGRVPVEKLPEVYIIFQCMGWFCDENNSIYELNDTGLAYGRRSAVVDGAYAQDLIMNASSFLESQVQENGSFIYGYYPRFDNEIENYNIVRHASTIWSLICRYRLSPDDKLAEKIDKAIDFMLENVLYDSQGRAYLYEAKADEIKLGGCGMAVVAMTEYMDVFKNGKYTDVCCALGEGILTMMDQDSGEYFHVLNGDFSRKEKYRTVYYDGEATFALCRLYSLTSDELWLDAAQSAVDRFIAEDYTQYKDHWVAYSMNEITKHISDRQDYYAFALANAQNNLQEISERDTTYHTYLELLMVTFEVYDRMMENGIDPGNFDLQAFLDTIRIRTNRQLDGYFYPEYAMYMRNPQRILNTFMVRHDGYRVRIDDVQHNIGGYYLYAKNYEKLVSCGLLNNDKINLR